MWIRAMNSSIPPRTYGSLSGVATASHGGSRGTARHFQRAEVLLQVNQRTHAGSTTSERLAEQPKFLSLNTHSLALSLLERARRVFGASASCSTGIPIYHHRFRFFLQSRSDRTIKRSAREEIGIDQILPALTSVPIQIAFRVRFLLIMIVLNSFRCERPDEPSKQSHRAH